MPRSLILWGMLLKEVDFLLDIETERFLRKESRTITLPRSGRQTVEAYRLVWQCYDRLLAYRHSAGEERIKQNWEACLAEEGLNASDALVRLTYVYLERMERVGVICPTAALSGMWPASVGVHGRIVKPSVRHPIDLAPKPRQCAEIPRGCSGRG